MKDIQESILTDKEIELEFAYISGYVTAMTDAKLPANFAICLVRHIESLYGLAPPKPADLQEKQTAS